MKYNDLIAFEPIDSVKVLREADDAAAARRDVETLVISPKLGEALSEVILPNLNLDQPLDAKGILVVANYGTGKTHVMSVVSAIAENADLVAVLANDAIRTAFGPVAGRYRVIRAEIGYTDMSLRDIVCTELTVGLEKLGVAYSFPSAATVTNTKDSLVKMMEAFEAVHPDSGLLFVLDELLDHLRNRHDAELIKDLTFLREIGEICRSTRLRFIAGVQEAIFENPRFANAADAVRRVKDRFTQMRILREDIAYVVQERLLRKTPVQKAKIREHLQTFTPAYAGMAENLEQFVSMFPVHPAYLVTFEQVSFAEKRKILTTLSEEMRKIFTTEVPTNAPGLVCYDTYCSQLEADPSNRAVPEIRDVLDRTSVLRNRIDKALPTPAYRPVAQRIVNALAVHRLTTEDINAPIGPTIPELRDDLTLLPPDLPEMDAFFLETTIGSIIEDIIRAVSGQFISQNEANGQIYLDIRKDIDYDTKILERAISLDKVKLDEAYFKALETVLDQRESPYVAGYRIWPYELPWAAKSVTRPGYLFMGAPNERSTAQPARDFYTYFLQPYAPPPFKDEAKQDEVFIRLATPDETFTQSLRRYAGAVALELESTGPHKTVYAEKRVGYLKDMVDWLKAHMGDAMTVTYKGEVKPLGSWLAQAQGPRGTVKDQVDTIAAWVLAAHFDERYPGYPTFGMQVTRANLAETVKQALNQIITSRPNALGGKALAAIGLVDHQGNLIDTGVFATNLLAQVEAAGGQALNRSALLTERVAGVPTWGPWFLEPAWLVVVAAALTQLGRLELGYSDGQMDALNLEKLTRLSLDDLEKISHVAPPKELPLTILKEVVKLLDLPVGAIGAQGASETLVQQVATKCTEYIDRLIEAKSILAENLNVWGAPVIENQPERSIAIKAFDDLLNNLKARNSVGKINKIDLTAEQVKKARDGKNILTYLKDLAASAEHLSNPIAYLREATEVFGPADPVAQDATALRKEILEVFRKGQSPDPGKVASLKAACEDLRRRFLEAAIAAHQRDCLDGAGDERKRKVVEGSSYKDLVELSAIPLLPGGKFASLQNRAIEMKVCKTFDPAVLKESVSCSHCNYRPKPATGPTASAALEQFENQIITLRTEWEKALADSLAVAEMEAQINLLSKPEQVVVKAFVTSRSLPSPINPIFVQAVSRVLTRFEVRNILPSEVWKAIFPEAVPATIPELTSRFRSYLDELSQGTDVERLRIVPAEETQP